MPGPASLRRSTSAATRGPRPRSTSCSTATSRCSTSSRRPGRRTRDMSATTSGRRSGHCRPAPWTARPSTASTPSCAAAAGAVRASPGSSPPGHDGAPVRRPVPVARVQADAGRDDPAHPLHSVWCAQRAVRAEAQPEAPGPEEAGRLLQARLGRGQDLGHLRLARHGHRLPPRRALRDPPLVRRPRARRPGPPPQRQRARPPREGHETHRQRRISLDEDTVDVLEPTSPASTRRPGASGPSRLPMLFCSRTHRPAMSP